jgi:hypothetical protein
MLVGADYFITHDHILDPCGTRFAWNISRDDKMPVIIPIRGSEGFVNLTDPKDGFVRGRFSTMIKGGSSHLALVTHKTDVKVVPHKRVRGQPAPPFVRIATSGSLDEVFRSGGDIHHEDGDTRFSGRAGVIRHHTDGRTELAMFDGRLIGANGVEIETDPPGIGISASFCEASAVQGRIFSRSGGTLRMHGPLGGEFYLNGLEIPDDKGAFRIPHGAFHWEYTRGLPVPMQPLMLRTENRAGGATVFFRKANAATRHRIETSRNNGLTWTPAGETEEHRIELTGFPNGRKIHVRAVGLNSEREGPPANEYPIYVTADAPLPPDGLRAVVRGNNICLTWGQILGVTEYQLYRRKKGETNWRPVFSGLANEFTDRITCNPPYAEPGLRSAAGRGSTPGTIHEYALAAVNHNGEGTKSLTADTNPTSWRYWNPSPDFRFKRRSGFWLPPYVRPVDVPPGALSGTVISQGAGTSPHPHAVATQFQRRAINFDSAR